MRRLQATTMHAWWKQESNKTTGYKIIYFTHNEKKQSGGK